MVYVHMLHLVYWSLQLNVLCEVYLAASSNSGSVTEDELYTLVDALRYAPLLSGIGWKIS